ncbi:ABC transporter substrate-binding protein [Amorphus sp. 3PC139-8]|uniref:ABC transporter substrate-binding protein n=1 Tax=Amorphus sp. 3PC139-8 TaxID=2735676 RepID=UPI00345D2CB8
MISKRTVLAGAAIAAVAFTGLAAPAAEAQDGELFIPLLTYRTGPFAGSGIPVANGMHDYLNMLNERDGGVGGVKIKIEECETGYNTQKGVECYESTKNQDPLIYNPWSTGITLQLIPKAAVDKIPVLSMAYGLSAAADGEVFPWVFNPPDTYWDAASAIIKYIAEQEGGDLSNLKGKKIGYIFLDAGYGREPIPLLEQFAKDYGFTLTQYPVPVDQMQNQSSQWLNVRRDRPDYMIMWGWGAMNPTGVKEAAKIRFPMDKFVSVWWPGEDDVRPAGDSAKGFKTLNFHGVGADYPAIQDILTYVVDKGMSQVSDKARVGENLYNRGVLNSFLMAEAIRTAQEMTGKTMIDASDMRVGLENLNITAERLKEAGLDGFMSPLKLTCSDHSGENDLYIQQWDGENWQKVSDWFPPMKEVVRPMLVKAAEEYVASNQPWPERSEPCAQ